MIVYGDQVRLAAAPDILDEIAATLAQAPSLAEPARRDALVSALILAGQLQQGLEDRAMERRGADDHSHAGDAAGALTLSLARLAGGVGSLPDMEAALAGVLRCAPDEPLILKTPEGYAFYAVHPLAYFEAGRAWAGRLGAVIGLRSIGTSLGAMVAVGAGLSRAFSLRPVGPPFDRRIEASAGLRETITSAPNLMAIVDEGPGLSGSSFGAVADWLEAAGVDPGRLVFFPSHAGNPGPLASARHRRRWAFARKVAPERAQPDLSAFEHALGRTGVVEVLSGGGWRELLDLAAPVHRSGERLKARVSTERGKFLVKFSGYGAVGEEKFALARCLYQAGWAPEPMALAEGFIATRWIEGTPGVDGVNRRDLAAHLGRYLAFRSRDLVPGPSGAPLAALVDMARRNIAEADLDAGGFERFDLRAIADHWRPVRIDGRLHPWEWVRTDEGRILKLDALDHHAAHDLVGCQDPAWDLAGAAVEFALSPNEQDALLAAYGLPVDPEAMALARLLYIGFQIGLWTMARDQAAAEDRPAIEGLLAKYRDAL